MPHEVRAESHGCPYAAPLLLYITSSTVQQDQREIRDFGRCTAVSPAISTASALSLCQAFAHSLTLVEIVAYLSFLLRLAYNGGFKSLASDTRHPFPFPSSFFVLSRCMISCLLQSSINISVIVQQTTNISHTHDRLAPSTEPLPRTRSLCSRDGRQGRWHKMGMPIMLKGSPCERMHP